MTQSILYKSLELLEKNYWPNPGESSTYLIKTCHLLRKKPLGKLNVEDLRMLIGQNIGIEFLLPIAIGILKKNILAEGDYYPGDLLINVMNSEFWMHKSELKIELIDACNSQVEKLESTALLRNSFLNFVAKGA